MQHYRADLARDGFVADPVQKQAVVLLQSLYEDLHDPGESPAFWRRLWRRRALATKGVYLWGGPGRGKTYLMDCFYESLEFEAKRRFHFHRFMLLVHESLGALPKTPDPLKIVAGQWAADCRILCLDEFHVTDIADAMLLAGLLDALFAQGVTLVATSNTEPGQLYRDGLQRDRFLPAIDLLEQHACVFELVGTEDFRLAHLRHNGTYRVFAGEQQSESWLARRMQELAPLQQRQNVELQIAGRMLRVRAVAEDVAWVTFTELCRQPRSTRDYLELAREFHTLLLAQVPRLGEDQDEAARRFVHLIDALYDHKVKLVIAAEAEPDQLYQGQRLKALFRRTSSRLNEMTGEAYMKLPHHVD